MLYLGAIILSTSSYRSDLTFMRHSTSFFDNFAPYMLKFMIVCRTAFSRCVVSHCILRSSISGSFWIGVVACVCLVTSVSVSSSKMLVTMFLQRVKKFFKLVFIRRQLSRETCWKMSTSIFLLYPSYH